jgi:hypothetical protein
MRSDRVKGPEVLVTSRPSPSDVQEAAVGVLIFEVTEGSASSGGSHCVVSSAPWRAVLMLGLMLANGPRVWPSRPNGRAGLEKQKNPELDIVLLDIGLRFVDRLRTPNRSGSP